MTAKKKPSKLARELQKAHAYFAAGSTVEFATFTGESGVVFVSDPKPVGQRALEFLENWRGTHEDALLDLKELLAQSKRPRKALDEAMVGNIIGNSMSTTETVQRIVEWHNDEKELIYETIRNLNKTAAAQK